MQMNRNATERAQTYTDGKDVKYSMCLVSIKVRKDSLKGEVTFFSIMFYAMPPV